MPGTGLEPASLAAHAPQACLFTNFSTPALPAKDFTILPETAKLGTMKPLALREITVTASLAALSAAAQTMQLSLVNFLR